MKKKPKSFRDKILGWCKVCKLRISGKKKYVRMRRAHRFEEGNFYKFFRGLGHLYRISEQDNYIQIGDSIAEFDRWGNNYLAVECPLPKTLEEFKATVKLLKMAYDKIRRRSDFKEKHEFSSYSLKVTREAGTLTGNPVYRCSVDFSEKGGYTHLFSITDKELFKRRNLFEDIVEGLEALRKERESGDTLKRSALVEEEIPFGLYGETKAVILDIKHD